MMRYFLVSLVPLALALAVAGCADPDNTLEGSLGSQYDLSFDSTAARQYVRSKSLVVEYVRGERGSEEKPIIISISPQPGGPGRFTYEDEQVQISSSLLPGRPNLPELTSGTIDIDEYTPDEPDSPVEGSVHAMFTNEGTGDAFSLEGNFKTTLEIINL